MLHVGDSNTVQIYGCYKGTNVSKQVEHAVMKDGHAFAGVCFSCRGSNSGLSRIKHVVSLFKLASLSLVKAVVESRLRAAVQKAAGAALFELKTIYADPANAEHCTEYSLVLSAIS